VTGYIDKQFTGVLACRACWLALIMSSPFSLSLVNVFIITNCLSGGHDLLLIIQVENRNGVKGEREEGRRWREGGGQG